MAKARHVFVCRTCGAVQQRWMGKCPDCGEWDSLEDQRVDRAAAADPQLGAARGMVDALETGDALEAPVAKRLGEIGEEDEPGQRITCGIHELDRVLGGGLVRGSAVLIGGEPGIGKSTLLLQAAQAWAAQGRRVLYVSSEESARQLRMRAERLGEGRAETENGDGVNQASRGRAGQGGKFGQRRGGKEEALTLPSPAEPGEGARRRTTAGSAALVEGEAARGNDADLFILADSNLARIVEQARKVGPAVMVVDSVQMIYKADLPASPGSLTQLRRCCAELVYLAKLSGVAVVMVGHVTKDGQLAGPRLLEHLVDAVLYFEGDRYHAHRVVRAVKNRFGTTLEIGLFEMTGGGLREAPEGAGVAAVTGDATPRPGSVVCPVVTGTRCVLVELQALTATGFLGAAKRKSSGLDANRLAMLIAVLEQHAGLRLADRDVFASSVGGIRIAEPAADLALLLAIAGAHYKRALAPGTAAIGEVGLGGEVRTVGHIDQRVREAERMGYTRLIVPWSGKQKSGGARGGAGKSALELVPVRNVGQAIEQLG